MLRDNKCVYEEGNPPRGWGSVSVSSLTYDHPLKPLTEQKGRYQGNTKGNIKCKAKCNSKGNAKGNPNVS